MGTNNTGGAVEQKRRPFYRRGWFIALVVVIAVPLIAVGWYLGSPLFLNKTVVEAFPVVTTAAPTSDTDAQADVDSATTSTSVDTDGASQDQGVATDSGTSDTASGPVAVLTGSFEGADSSHQGSGSVAIYEFEDGSHVLRFEDLDVTNGPDLHVIVSPVPHPETRDEVSADGYLDLGGLKGNRGDQNYELPPDFDPSQVGSVVIYCVPFHVIFATATLS